MWITFFLAALSARETADTIALTDLLRFAVLTAISNLLKMSLLVISFFLEPLRALLAVLVIGIIICDCEYTLKRLEYQLRTWKI